MEKDTNIDISPKVNHNKPKSQQSSTYDRVIKTLGTQTLSPTVTRMIQFFKNHEGKVITNKEVIDFLWIAKATFKKYRRDYAWMLKTDKKQLHFIWRWSYLYGTNQQKEQAEKDYLPEIIKNILNYFKKNPNRIIKKEEVMEAVNISYHSFWTHISKYRSVFKSNWKDLHTIGDRSGYIYTSEKEKANIIKHYNTTIQDNTVLTKRAGELSSFFQKNEGTLFTREQLAKELDVSLRNFSKILSEYKTFFSQQIQERNVHNIYWKWYMYGTIEQKNELERKIFPYKTRIRKKTKRKLITLPVASEFRDNPRSAEDTLTKEKLAEFTTYIMTLSRDSKKTPKQICTKIKIPESLFFEYLKQAREKINKWEIVNTTSRQYYYQEEKYNIDSFLKNR